jgi:hypothetical protein
MFVLDHIFRTYNKTLTVSNVKIIYGKFYGDRREKFLQQSTAKETKYFQGTNRGAVSKVFLTILSALSPRC